MSTPTPIGTISTTHGLLGAAIEDMERRMPQARAGDVVVLTAAAGWRRAFIKTREYGWLGVD